MRAPAKDETSKPKPIKLADDGPDGRSEPTMGSSGDAPTIAGAKPPGIAAARNGKADDLRAISGIGPKIEEALHEHGIYHYDQIAKWTAANAAWIDGVLKFKGRVEREKWVEQAQELVSNADG